MLVSAVANFVQIFLALNFFVSKNPFEGIYLMSFRVFLQFMKIRRLAFSEVYPNNTISNKNILKNMTSRMTSRISKYLHFVIPFPPLILQNNSLSLVWLGYTLSDFSSVIHAYAAIEYENITLIKKFPEFIQKIQNTSFIHQK